MSVESDPALYKSNFERTENDRYWTENWITYALLDSGIGPIADAHNIWEPACGRGDMAMPLIMEGFEVFASDIDPSEYPENLGNSREINFLKIDSPPQSSLNCIVTNPPFSKEADLFLRNALSMDQITYVAFLLRAEFGHGGRRKDLFELDSFAGEVKLTSRPRWDWWFRDKPKASPRHNFSWFVWDKASIGVPNTTCFAGRKKNV